MPKPTLILNPAQAEAVYSAMCALNNVSAKLKAMFGDVADEGINVFEDAAGNVRVVSVRRYDALRSEDYASQNAFATAYGLNADAVHDDVEQRWEAEKRVLDGRAA